MKSRVQRRLRVVLAVVVVASTVLQPGAAADRVGDERTEMVRRQMELLSELDELAASDAELTDALATLDLWAALQAAEVERTQAQLAEATLAVQQALAAQRSKEAEVDDLEHLMAVMAVNAYVQPPSADALATLHSTSAPGDAARLTVYLDVKAQRDTDVVTRLRRAREQLTRLRERREASEARAESAHDEAARTLADLAATRDRFAEIQREVQDRRVGATHESELFALALDRSNAWLVADAKARGTSGVPLASARGIRVHRSIAGQLDLLLQAAEADGVRLGGGGYRTNAEQVALRHAHCGDDPYSVYEKPAGECSPPTARPGTSMHELGLAIDFTYNGAVIGSHGDRGFRWLAENAHRFGFYNLPSEPWHWSINGS